MNLKRANEEMRCMAADNSNYTICVSNYSFEKIAYSGNTI